MIYPEGFIVLSDIDIRRYIEMVKIKTGPPLLGEQLGSCSVDLRLAGEPCYAGQLHPLASRLGAEVAK